jgi:hypothetical protein
MPDEIRQPKKKQLEWWRPCGTTYPYAPWLTADELCEGIEFLTAETRHAGLSCTLPSPEQIRQVLGAVFDNHQSGLNIDQIMGVQQHVFQFPMAAADPMQIEYEDPEDSSLVEVDHQKFARGAPESETKPPWQGLVFHEAIEKAVDAIIAAVTKEDRRNGSAAADGELGKVGKTLFSWLIWAARAEYRVDPQKLVECLKNRGVTHPERFANSQKYGIEVFAEYSGISKGTLDNLKNKTIPDLLNDIREELGLNSDCYLDIVRVLCVRYRNRPEFITDVPLPITNGRRES